MKNPSASEVIIATLEAINRALASNSNALTSTRAGRVDPEAAYIELVRELLSLEH